MTSRMGKAGEEGWIRTERDSDLLLLTAGGRWLNATLADIDDTAAAARRHGKMDAIRLRQFRRKHGGINNSRMLQSLGQRHSISA